ncbi:kelch-like protein 8 isoform X3 [Lytechinus variegatus]|uniref:kelch-like protein 8 isoform X3 n=1 Tax=Lytechinus variegatus TaxID=7654 RepID=UPI001BB1100D|nr:kelch-like protein 8 isoform X3 [Lytechinus variegatus]
MPRVKRTNSVIIIEFSGKTSSPTNKSVLIEDEIVKMGSPPQMYDSFVTSFTFDCQTQWRESLVVIQQLYKTKALCDFTLRCGTSSFLCHRLVLAACSPYFRAMFMSEMIESRQDSLEVQDIDEKSLEAIVEFMYTSKIVLNVDNVQKILFAGSLLQMDEISKACSDFMKCHLHPSNCLGVRTFADQHGCTTLSGAADSYAHEHFLEVVSQEEFFSIDAPHLIALISSHDIMIQHESQVYEAIIKWVKFDVPNRERHLAALLSKVRLPMVPANYLTEEVEREELIKKCHKCRDLVDEAKNYHLSVGKLLRDTPTSSLVKDPNRLTPRKSSAGVLFVVGGRGATGDPFKSNECYDLRNNRWIPVTEMSMKRRHVGVTATDAGHIFAVGGFDGRDHLNTAEKFDPHTNKWTNLAPMAKARRGLGVTQLGTPIYAIGGLDDNLCYSDVERYDPQTNSWSLAQSMNCARGGVAVAVLNGLIYAVGGNDGSSTLNSCERYDPHLNKWTIITPMNTRRAGGGAAVIDGFLYAIGGFDHSSPLNTVERYDPQKNDWISMTPMSTSRGGVGVSVLGGKIFAIGGHNGSNYLTSVECYDPITNSWSAVQDIGTCRAGAGVAICHCLISSLKEIPRPNMVSCV